MLVCFFSTINHNHNHNHNIIHNNNTGCIKPKAPPTLSPTSSPIITTERPTPKPIRTKRPTPQPTIFISESPTLSSPPTTPLPSTSPVSSPTFSPIPRPLLIDISSNGNYRINDDELTQQLQQQQQLQQGGGGTGGSQQSYGIIFDIQTQQYSGAVQVQSIEFYIPPIITIIQSEGGPSNYTAQEYNIAYEIYSKSGTWHGFEGKERAFTKVSHGNITIIPTATATNNSDNNNDRRKRRFMQSESNGFSGFGVGSASNTQQQSSDDNNFIIQSTEGGLIRIPPTQFTPINMNGGGARYSMYIILSSRDLLYARSSSSSSNGDESIESKEEEEQSITSIAQINAGPKLDTVKLVETEDIIVYEGAAVMISPFSNANQRIYYRKPRGFVGRIWYHRKPCEDIVALIVNDSDNITTTSNNNDDDDELTEQSNGNTRERRRRRRRELTEVVNWKDCIETNDVDLKLMPLKDMPQLFLPSNSNQNNNGANIPTNLNGTPPTLSPTISHAPTINTMKVNLILTLHNVNAATYDYGTGTSINRVLSSTEQEEFESTTINFYDSQELLEINEVELYGCNVHYQQIFEPPESSSSSSGSDDNFVDGNNNGLGRRIRSLQQVPPLDNNNAPGSSFEGSTVAVVPEEATPINGTEAFLNSTNTTANATSIVEGPPVPPPSPPPTEWQLSATTLEVTLVVSVLYSQLPHQITQELLLTLLIHNEMEYISLLKSNPILSTYFSPLDSMPLVIAVEEITEPPTISPSAASTPNNSTLDDVKYEMSTPMLIAIIALLSYALLACCSMLHVKRARQKMRMERAKRFVSENGLGGAGAASATAYIGHGMTYEDDDTKSSRTKMRKKGTRYMSSRLMKGMSFKRRSSKLSSFDEDEDDHVDKDEEMIGLNGLTESDSHDDDGGEVDESEESYSEDDDESEYSEEESDESSVSYRSMG